MAPLLRLVVLVFLLLVLAFPESPVRPSPAEASLPQDGGNPGPLNFSFDAPSRPTGSPPANYDLSVTPSPSVAPAKSHFEADSLTPEWTINSGTPSIVSGGPTGKFLRTYPSAQEVVLTSSAFSAQASAQIIGFDYRYQGSGCSVYDINVLRAPDFATEENIPGAGGSSGPTSWTSNKANFSIWAGMTIKRVRGLGGAKWNT
jgi:hypothetical protein